MMKYYLGMDIGGTKCAVILYDKSTNTIIEKIRFDTDVSRGNKLIINELISSANILIGNNNIDKKQISCCGISCGGPLDSNKGIIMSPPNLPDWDNIHLTEIVSESLGIKSKVINDADACAIAEWKYGAGIGSNNMIFLTFGTGMGAGLILNGRLYSGTSGTAGEVGHIRLSESGPIGYNKAGSFEGFCSGGGIIRLAEIMLNNYSGCSILDSKNLTAKSIADAAHNGDELSVNIYRTCGKYLGRGLSVLIDILNPEKIIIGSIYERSGDLLLDEMNKEINKEALSCNLKACEIVPSKLGDNIGDYASIAVAHYFEENNYE